MHRDFFEDNRVPSRGTKRATAAPRGYAKSTLEALIKPIHDICYGLEKYIIILSNTDSQASGRTSDIRNELLTNQALIDAFGRFFKIRRTAESTFVAWGAEGIPIQIQGYGAGAEIRGVKWGQYRPSKIICDDVENSEDVESETLRADYENWYNDVVSELGDKETNMRVVGTVLHRESLLKKLLNNPIYSSRFYKAVESFDQSPQLWEKWSQIKKDLTNPNRHDEAKSFYVRNEPEMLKGVSVLWPEKESYYDLQCAILERGRRSFFKEKQNDPRTSNRAIFDVESFDYFDVDSTGSIVVEKDGRVLRRDRVSQRFGVLDPATGQGKKPKRGALGDFAVLLTGVTDEYGYLYVIDAWIRREPPTKQIHAIFDYNDVWQYDKFGIETNLYRELMLPDILEEKRRREEKRRDEGVKGYGIKISFYDIVNTEKKEARIYTLEPKIQNGYIKFNRALSQEFFNQMEQFPLGDNDDCPDALEMLYNLANRRYEASAVGIKSTQR